MGKLEKAFRFIISKTVAAAILGFLLSIFTTEIVYAVPQGMEIVFAEVLLVPILLLLIYILGLFNRGRQLWWEWKRFRAPMKMGILRGYVDDLEKGHECKPVFSIYGGWSTFFQKSKSNESSIFDVEELYWSDISSKYAVLVNPFGEIYLEEDRRNFTTYERIKEFVADGGIFCCTGGFPFYYHWDPVTDLPVDTTPKTRVSTSAGLQDIRLFFDSLVTKDFGAVIVNFPDKPTPAKVYQEKKPDVEFFGELVETGGSDTVQEFRSLSKETRGLIPGLRTKHDEEMKFPLAAISYGEGYLIVAGMDVRTKVEFEKLGKGIENFANEIAKRHSKS